MLKYIAFVWDGRNASTTALVQRLSRQLRAGGSRWHCAVDRPGVWVSLAGARQHSAKAYELTDNQGVVLGTIFRRSDTGAAAGTDVSFDAEETRRLLDSEGRRFVADYWGNYVALLHDAKRARTWVLRGPASSFPCFRVEHQGIEIYFSRIEDCIALGLPTFSIDWDYIGVWLTTTVAVRATGLREVSQILPGECTGIANGISATRAYWDPVAIARDGVIEAVDEATACMRDTVSQCVHSWAACYDSILLSLSGGLDSSIVLAALKNAPRRPQITCVTEHSPGSSSDERSYARAMVEKAACAAHIERRRNSEVSLRQMFSAALSPVPQGYVRRIETTRWQADLALEREATAIFSGSGGDQLFCQSGARLGVSDFIGRHGIGRGLGRIAYDAAQLEGSSIWRVLREAIQANLRPEPHDAVVRSLRHLRLITADARRRLESLPASAAPWRHSAGNASPGTQAHIDGLCVLDDYYDPMALPDDPEQVAPLFSQPLMEATLRMPTYVLMVGGWDRGLARRAFADDLAPEVARRRSKGGIEEHMHELLRGNAAFARELLLDGLLVDRGLLDRSKIEEVLSDRPSTLMRGMAEICRHLSTEVWLRTWQGVAQRAAA